MHRRRNPKEISKGGKKLPDWMDSCASKEWHLRKAHNSKTMLLEQVANHKEKVNSVGETWIEIKEKIRDRVEIDEI